MKVIQEAITRLEAERAAYNARIDGRIEGLREALRLQGGGAVVESPAIRMRRKRGDLKDTVLSLAQEVGENGLTTESCVARAKEKGVELLPASVSSLLSRLKNDGVMFFDGSVYRLKQYAGPRNAA